MDPAVKITSYADGFDFQVGSLPRAATVVTFNVGSYGPFTVRLPQAAGTPAAVQAAIQAKVDELRSAGLV